MHFGLVLPIARADGDVAALLTELVAECRAAEAAGFDAAFLPEFHQARVGAAVSPLVVLSHLAAKTTRLKFGTSVLAGPLHHPIRLAEDSIMLDHLTGGRFILGLGIGHMPEDFAAYGVAHAKRAPRLDELLEVLERAFAGGPFRYEGDYYQLDVTGITPGPLTVPRPPLWLGGHSPSGLDRAARHADRWIADPQRDVATIAVLAELYRERCARHGVTPRVAIVRDAWLSESRAQAEVEWAPHALAVHRLYWHVGAYQEDLEPWLRDVRDGDDFSLARVAPGRFLMGTGAELRDEIGSWTGETGADYLALRFRQPGGPPHTRVLETLEAFGRDVVAPLSDATAPNGTH